MSLASTVVEWAADRVMAPHAEHRDPAQHPQCLICRATTMLAPGVTAARESRGPVPEILWIDIVDDPDGPDSAAA
jgi:hypothetical protein